MEAHASSGAVGSINMKREWKGSLYASPQEVVWPSSLPSWLSIPGIIQRPSVVKEFGCEQDPEPSSLITCLSLSFPN